MTSPHCNGNCLQGRRCDCVPELESDEPDAMTRVVDLVLAVVVVAMIVAVALLLEGASK